MVKKLFDKLKLLPNWLVVLLLFEFVFRIPSFFEPFSYGDEMIYLTLGEGIRQGLVLYRDLHDNKPPLLYYMAAIAGNVFWFRVILTLWLGCTTILFWKLVDRLSKNQILVKVATATFAVLTTLPLLEGNIANAEVFMIGFSIAAFLLLFTYTNSKKAIFGAGVLFSFTALFKIPGAFDLPVIVFFWLLIAKYNKKTFYEFIKASIIISVGFIIPILVTFVWYHYQGALGDYIKAAYFQNVGYLSSWRPSDSEKPFLVKNGPLLFRGGVILVGLILLKFFQKKLSKLFIFTCIWVLFSLFAVTLSERPYPHYLIQSVPSVSILIGILVASKTVEQSLVVIPLLVVFIVPVYYKFYYYKTFAYYERFLLFATSQISKEEYFSRFDGNVSRNYKVARFIKSHTLSHDQVFVWGDSPPIYALSRRLPPVKFVAEYHINDFSNKQAVFNQLDDKQPKIIVVLPNALLFEELNTLIEKSYLHLSTIDGANVWIRRPKAAARI